MLHIIFGYQFDIAKPYPFYPPDFGSELCTGSTNLTFDIIVCGSGTAGSIVAARLSEVQNWTVLLLEFGEDPPIYSYVPDTSKQLAGTYLDYGYMSEKNEGFFQALPNDVTVIGSGKATGGSAAINGEYYFRPTRYDMDSWEYDAGCRGWNYNDTKRYMIKAENFHDNKRFNPEYHGTEGYQDVSRYRSDDPDIPVLEKGFEQMALPYREDFNLGESIGYGSSDSTTAHGIRVSTARGYLSPITLRPNFYFARRVLVRKVLIADDNKKPFLRAIGVEITAPNGETCTVSSKIEVVLSLGPIRSPHILLLSGIGPGQHLKAMGIPVRADLPIGRGFKDHASYDGNILTRPADDTTSSSPDGKTSSSKLLNEGIATHGIGQVNALFSSNAGAIGNNLQIQLSKVPKGTLTVNSSAYAKLGMKEDVAKLYAKMNENSDLLILRLVLVDVKSRGYIELNSPDAAVYPKIQTAILNDENDLKAMIDGLKWIRKFTDTPAIRNSGYRLQRIDYPACKNFSDYSDEYYLCSLKQTARSYFHPQCTVKMGPTDRTDAPLTPDLKVKGFANLRVIDASSFPLTISRNTNAAVIMLAEKAADTIKKDNGQIIDYYTTGLYV